MVRVKILLYARDKTSLGHKLNFTKKKKYQDISTAQWIDLKFPVALFTVHSHLKDIIVHIKLKE